MGTKKYMGKDKHADKQTDRHINTMNRPGLRAGPIENSSYIITVRPCEHTEPCPHNWCDPMEVLYGKVIDNDGGIHKQDRILCCVHSVRASPMPNHTVSL